MVWPSEINEVNHRKQLAQQMGISERHLRLLLERDGVEGKKLGHDWVVLSLDYKRKRKPKRRAER